MKAVVVVSGGMDSVTALYRTCKLTSNASNDIRMISFDYGQKHKKELEYATWHAEELNLKHNIVDLTSISALLTSSALVGDQPVPEGHYADETMKATVVPNRNMMMLSIATAVAVDDGATFVVAGMHAGDHPIYPDCRPEFIDLMNETVRVATQDFSTVGFRIWTPFINLSKAEIVLEGKRLGVRYERTWSCYKGYHLHCGKCGTCVERKEAFQLAGVVDPTTYEV